ncbi:MAG: hypothetical protein O7B29_08010 [Deltaproteobacteria bacterium]|nr:hypothetical protein [Deltaproteobacteria bacterium]
MSKRRFGWAAVFGTLVAAFGVLLLLPCLAGLRDNAQGVAGDAVD